MLLTIKVYTSTLNTHSQKTSAGIGVPNVAAQPLICGFFCAYRTAFLYGGLGGAVARLAGRDLRTPTLFSPPPNDWRRLAAGF